MSQPRSRELTGKVSFTAGCSRFYVNVESSQKTGYLAQQSEQFVGSFTKRTALLVSN